MNAKSLVETLQKYQERFPLERESCSKTISLLEKYGDDCYENQHWEGHITASMIIINPEKTKTLLMLHKKFNKWLQFGGHSDGDPDTFATALREFHEESGIEVEPECNGEIFFVDVHPISADLKGRPSHFHHDIMYLGIIGEDTPFSRQEDEVDDIRWFSLDGIEQYLDSNMMERIHKIRNHG
ncbi:NUDIX hydrolase [Candidatus Gracilibacteria bacterium]|nr:NUDIX hydrolase [Candidatus Gracilibacteria bacterium]